jgi:hypothetical protein
MDNSAFLHIPSSLAFSDPRLFWLLALELYRADLQTECDHLLNSDWSETLSDEDSEDIASKLAMLAFSKEDLPRLQTISEGFSPNKHTLFFQRLRDFGKKNPQAKKCIGWMQSQRLIGKGIDGFKDALKEGHAELARSLYMPTPSEAEAIFYEITPSLTKESLGLLLFQCPRLADIKTLMHGVQSRAPEDALSFLVWKIEDAHAKSYLRNPNGDETILPALFSAALCRKQFTLAKKLLDWNHSLAFDKYEPKELATPWDGDTSTIKLDGSIQMTPADFACFFNHEGFSRALGMLSSPPPSLPKINALLAAFAKKLEARKPGQSQAWMQERISRCEFLSKSIWHST